MKKIVSISAVVLVISSLACAVPMGTVYVQSHSNGLSDTGYITGAGLNNLNGYTGIYSFTITSSTGAGAYVPNWGFCSDLTQGTVTGWADVIALQDGPLPSAYGTPMGVTKANYIRELWGRFFNPAWATGVDKQGAEAFGTAVWEIIYETDSTWDVTAGTGFKASGIEQAANANSWLSQLNQDSQYFANNLVLISSSAGQDFLVQIPEPMTICLLGLGALAMIRKSRSA